MLTFNQISDCEYEIRFRNGVLCGDLLKEVDGYFVYWPTEKRSGCMQAWFLRSIADKLDELNREWDKEVQALCRANSNQPSAR